MFRNYPCHQHTITPPKPSLLSSLICSTQSWLGKTQSAPPVPPGPPSSPATQGIGQLGTGQQAPPQSSTAVLIGTMAGPLPLPDEKHAWYYLHPKESLFIGFDAVSNFVWSIVSQLEINAKCEKTNSYFQQTAAQQLYSLIAVIAVSPLAILLTKKFYKESKQNATLLAIICGITAVCSVFAWDYFDLLGQQFFESLGYDKTTANYLAVLFPGPGTVAGPLQAVVMTLLSKALDPNFIFSKADFFVGISPISFLSPDVWKAVFDGMANVAKDSTWGLFGQAGLVALACGVTDFFTIKAITAIASSLSKPSTKTSSNHLSAPSANANLNASGGAPIAANAPAVATTVAPHVAVNINWNAMATTGSPLHSQPTQQQPPPVPPSQSTGLFRVFWQG